MIINKKYKYKDFKRIDGEERFYSFGALKVPSVTTILKKTQPKEKQDSLKKWRERVGEAEAEKIRDNAAAVGTALHKCLEKYILEKGNLKYFDDTPVGRQAREMANIIIGRSFFKIDEVWGCEVHLAGENYAGTTDAVGIFDGEPAIIDFKQTNKPKKEEWIEDYYLQLSAYAMAHNYMFSTNISQGYILMCSRDGYFPPFHLSPEMLSTYCDKWKKRLEIYYG